MQAIRKRYDQQCQQSSTVPDGYIHMINESDQSEELQYKRVTLNLSPQEFEDFRSFCKKHGRTFTDGIKRAIKLEMFITQQEESGNVVQIESNGKTVQLFRH